MSIISADQIRIVIALAALKHKHAAQSLASYTIELQEQFPLVLSQEKGEERWRKRALELEQQYEELLAKYESEQIKLLALKNSTSDRPQPFEPPTTTGPPRKKAKKKQPPQPADSDEASTGHSLPMPSKSPMTCQDPALNALVNTDSNTLFIALNDVHQLLSLTDVNPSLLVSVTKRLVQAAAGALNRLLDGTPGSLGVSSGPVALRALGNALNSTLSKVLPLLAAVSGGKDPAATSSMDSSSSHHLVDLVERVATLIMAPLVHAFNSLTTIYLVALFQQPGAAGQSAATNPTPSDDNAGRPPGRLNLQQLSNSQTPHQPLAKDTRPDTLHLFKSILITLDSCLQAAASTSTSVPHPLLVLSTLRHTLVAEIVRALYSLLSTRSSRNPEDAQARVSRCEQASYQVPDVSSRVKKLVLRDSLWYLCAVLHILFKDHLLAQPDAEKRYSRQEFYGEDDTSLSKHLKILQDAISDDICKLILKCKRSRFRRRSSVDGGPTHGGGKGEFQTSTDGGTGNPPEPGAAVIAGALCVDGDGASAAGQTCPDSGSDQGAVGPESLKTSTIPEVSEVDPASLDDGSYWLDDAEYDLLLGAIEAYWAWNGR